MNGRNDISFINELLSLINVPEIKESISAKLREAKLIYQPEVDAHFSEKLFRENTSDLNEDSPFFRMSCPDGKTGTNVDHWIIDSDLPGETENQVFTKSLIDFVISHKEDPETPYNHKFKTIGHNITLSFIRYSRTKILGKIHTIPVEDQQFRIIKPNVDLKNISEENQKKFFLRLFNSNRDIQREILDYFFNYLHPFLDEVI